MDDRLKDYIWEDDTSKKEQMSEKLINDQTISFVEERKLDNLLSLSFSEFDVSEETVQLLNEKNEDYTQLTEDVLLTINKRKNIRRFVYILSALAAVLVVGFFIILFKSDSKQEIVKNTDNKTQATFKEIVQLPEGVVIKIIEDSTYELINSEKEFLRLTNGKILVEVESRTNKTPLFFNMPESSVKVTGTVFTLMCDTKKSFVAVHEGTVEVEKEGKIVKVNANETYSSEILTNNIENHNSILTGLESSYFFESLDGLNIEGSPLIVKGKNGNGVEFNGNAKVVLHRTNKVIQETISFWFKINEFYDEPQSIIGQHLDSNSFLGFNIIIKSGALSIQLKDRKEMFKSNPIPISPNKWHHVVFTRDKSGVFALYLDGKLIASEKFNYWYSAENINLGQSPNPFWKPFIGSVDEVMVYNRPLSNEEVLQLYNKN